MHATLTRLFPGDSPGPMAPPAEEAPGDFPHTLDLQRRPFIP